ncbi:MAG: hypothetical protein ACXVRH_07425 [Thermoleophilaceae bacterium]
MKSPRVRFVAIALVALAALAPVAQARTVHIPRHTVHAQDPWRQLRGAVLLRAAQRANAASHARPSRVTVTGAPHFDVGSAAVGAGVAVALVAICGMGLLSTGVHVSARGAR